MSCGVKVHGTYTNNNKCAGLNEVQTQYTINNPQHLSSNSKDTLTVPTAATTITHHHS
jgi:hypothetical protein